MSAMPDLKELDDIVEAIKTLKAAGVGFFQAQVLLVNQCHLTMNAAGDRLRGAEALAGIRLDD